MENKFATANWEKIGVYLAICASLFTVIIYIFQIKDDIATLRERTAIVETRMDHLEERK